MTTDNDAQVTVATKVRDIPLKLTFGAIMALETFFESSILTFGPTLLAAKEPDYFTAAVIYNAMTGRKVGDPEAFKQGSLEMLRDVGVEEAHSAVCICLKQCLEAYHELQELIKNEPLLADIEVQKHPSLKLVH